MKIPSATGFAVVRPTELAFEYLKQTAEIVLVSKLAHLHTATFTRVP